MCIEYTKYMVKVKKKFKFVVVAVDVVIFTVHQGKLKVLLIKMKKKPFSGFWALPGGLIKVDEDLDKAARRHLQEKTGIKDIYLEQLYSFGRVDRDPFGRVVSVAYFALVPKDKYNLRTSAEYSDIDWFAVDDLPPLAYDHSEIVKKAIRRLQAKLTYTNIVYSLMPSQFTLSELQRVYEIILKKKLDKRNFRKKILSLRLIKATGRQRRGEAHRPADLYTFVKRKPQFISIL